MSLAQPALISNIIYLIIILLAAAAKAELIVQLNLNRPFNDVNEKFVSFTMQPEDLYKALDGPNRKTLTNMATLLGSSYIKFANDYNFIPDVEPKYPNPTKTIWKGFNRWTSAVNWTMIIPLPYNAGEWDPMESLKILNSSYLTGITDCVWQLGTKFGPSVTEYLNDLNTLNLMVDTFNAYVDDWEIIGAEIPYSSTNEEIKRFIELSKDMGAAFNWQQPADMSTSSTLMGSPYDLDRSLRAILNEKVPVWLIFLPKDQSEKSKQQSALVSSASRTSNDDIGNVLQWTQTLGEAASSGFDAVFQHINQFDLEHPGPSFYATVLFKKIMGSRVFPAHPFTIFFRTSKLYTHCANSISGGLAFMLVNADEVAKQIAISSITKLPGEEYWQYILTFRKNVAYLNNEKLSLNSTFSPQIKSKSPNKSVQLNSPPKSIGFWVLPNAELEQCQFTAVDVDELALEADDEKAVQKRHSSADKLLQQLIQNAALSHSVPTKLSNRGRRFATHTAGRARQAVVSDKAERVQTLAKLSLEGKPPQKREELLKDRRTAVLEWLKDLLDTAMHERQDLFALKRNTRSVDDYFGSIFRPKIGRKPIAKVKKITEIRKPEKKQIKPAYDPDHFDEEDFFKKMGAQPEPELPRVPDGDVHLKHIARADGEELDESDERREGSKNTAKNVQSTIGKETGHVVEPLRVLPTEYYEALPIAIPKLEPMNSNTDNTWNALLFPEPFKKNSNGNELKKNKNNALENLAHENAAQKIDGQTDVESVVTSQYQNDGQLAAEDFLDAQEELARSWHYPGMTPVAGDQEDETADTSKSLRSKYIDYLAENLQQYLAEDGIEGNHADMEGTTESLSPWWDSSVVRKRRARRALRYPLTEGAWLSNMITKDEELLPLGSVVPEKLVESEATFSNKMNKDGDMLVRNVKSNGYLRSVKDRVDRFMGIVTRHVNDWYNTFALPVDGVVMVVRENRLSALKNKK